MAKKKNDHKKCEDKKCDAKSSLWVDPKPSKPKFKIGDKVKIVNYDTVFNWGGKEMKLNGKKGVVTDVVHLSPRSIYHVRIEGSVWVFAESQLSRQDAGGEWAKEKI